MKILRALGAFVIVQCADARTWNNDGYSEETYSLFDWINYLKRLTLIVLMLSGVILYYVPESRPLIDLTANSLKSVLSPSESVDIYENIEPKYHRSRHDENCNRLLRNYKKSKSFVAGDGMLEGRERKKIHVKQSKDHGQSRHRFRYNTSKDVSVESCMEISKPVYYYSDKLEDVQKYLKKNLSGIKRANESGMENYAFLISGSPQQMAMLEHRYEKDDVIIVQEPYLNLECSECGTSMDKLSSKTGGSASDQEGPTRDSNNHATDSRIETFLKKSELDSIPENNVSRYDGDRHLSKPNYFQCDGELSGSNICSVSSANLNTKEGVRRSSRSTVTPTKYKNVIDDDESIYYIDYDNHPDNDSRTKLINSTNNRKVDFAKDVTRTQPKHEEAESHYKDAWKTRRNKSKLGELENNLHRGVRRGVSYSTDRGGEADDENSQLEGAAFKGDLDDTPQRENVYENILNDSQFDFTHDNMYPDEMMENRNTPTLLRAVNWIFGGCKKRCQSERKHGHVGKEENKGITDEWLLQSDPTQQRGKRL